MPDVQSIALGGGTCVSWDEEKVSKHLLVWREGVNVVT